MSILLFNIIDELIKEERDKIDQEVFFVLKVVMKGGLIDLCLFGYGTHGNLFGSFFIKTSQSCVEDFVLFVIVLC